MTTLKWTMAIMLATVVLSSCNKDEVAPHVAPPTQHHSHGAELRTAFNFHYGADPFDQNSTYLTGVGDVIRIDKAKFLIVGPQVFDMMGQVIGDFSDKYLLVDAASSQNDFLLGTVTDHHAHEIAFHIGLDSLTNHTVTPATADAPLNDVDMYWGAGTGYRFLVLEGLVDADGDGVPETTFSYHCGTDELRRWAEVMMHVDIIDGITTTVQFKVDLERILRNVDVANETHTHTTDDLPLATRIMDNCLDAITKQ